MHGICSLTDKHKDAHVSVSASVRKDKAVSHHHHTASVMGLRQMITVVAWAAILLK